MEQLIESLTFGDLVQLFLLSIAIVTVINNYGSRIKNLEETFKGLSRRQDTRRIECSEMMSQVVTSSFLNAKLDAIRGEIAHLNSGQAALFKKFESLYDLMIIRKD